MLWILRVFQNGTCISKRNNTKSVYLFARQYDSSLPPLLIGLCKRDGENTAL